MKSVIVDIKDGFAAVLSDDGCIEKIKDNNYSIGQVIYLKERKGMKSKKLAVMASTAAAFLMFCGATVWANVNPYSYVSLDVNPSIEFTLNRFDRVLSVEAVNADGEEILKKVTLDEVKYEKIDEALTMAIDAIYEEGYFTSDIEGDVEGGLVIATYGKDEEKSEELAERLGELAEGLEEGDTVADTEENDVNDENQEKDIVEESEEELANQDSDDEGLSVEVVSVGLQRVRDARELGVTPGKLNLVQKLQATMDNPDDFDTEVWLTKSVKEIQKATKENKKALKASVDSKVMEKEINDTTDVIVEDKGDEANTEAEEKMNKVEKTEKINSIEKKEKVDQIDKKENNNNGNARSAEVKQKSNNGIAKGNNGNGNNKK